jgi:16S rRNA (uracil1498-N3)-methyltransferase
MDCELDEGSEVLIGSAQMHHAANVLRLKVGAIVRIFNEKYGEWNCEISDIKKCTVICVSLFRKQRIEDGAILACCLINPNRMSIMLEKVTELGVSEIVPIISQYTQQRKFNYDKARQIIIGACEQSGRMTIPKLQKVVKLEEFLEKYSYDCKLIVGDESFSGKQRNCKDITAGKCAFLVGPEGGFSESERNLFDQYSFIEKISLGNNILRSETAAIAFAAAYCLS